MMDDRCKEVFGQILQTQLSKGKTKLNAEKIAKYLSRILGEEITIDTLIGVCDQFSYISDISGNTITIGEPTENEKNAMADNDIHSTAVDQAAKDMFEVYKPYESMCDAVKHIKENARIKYNVINLDNNNDNTYLIHHANRKFQYDYIVESVYHNTKYGTAMNNLIMKCKIDNTNMKIDIPLKAIIKK